MTDYNYDDPELWRQPEPGQETRRRPAPETEPADRSASTRLPRFWEILLGIGAFAGRRLLLSAPIIVGLILVLFFALGLTHGRTVSEAGRYTLSATPDYLIGLVQGELGTAHLASTSARRTTVNAVVARTLGKSLGLLAVSMVPATILGIGLGALAVARRYTRRAFLIILASLIGVSLPSFFVALLLQILEIRWVREFGFALVPVGGFGWDRHLILPALVLAARPLAHLARVTYASIAEVLRGEHIRTARGKGLKPRTVAIRHIFRNAAGPIVTTLGTSLRFSLSSLPVVEFYFAWPGVGFTLIWALNRQDDQLTVSLALAFALVFILLNIAIDGMYRALDPRIRQGAEEHRRDRGFIGQFAAIWADARGALLDNFVVRGLRRRLGQHGNARDQEFRRLVKRVLAEREIEGVAPDLYRRERLRAWLRGVFGNVPLVIGGILLLFLIGIFIFGPRYAPHNPYNVVGIRYSDGELQIPPFPPSATYPWGSDYLGRDMMSVVLTGAQQTLTLAVVVVLARMVLGLTLGSLAGWFEGTVLDRTIMGIGEALNSLPALIVAMIFILAMGVEGGLLVFVIALAVVGWTEIMQFVRGEVLSIRAKPYIDSAFAMGARVHAIIVRHILPNVLPVLIPLASLETAGVLMILAELGFLGIFIGGGTFVELDAANASAFSDVPEWAALLSNIRRHVRAYPWIGVYPAAAFFTAILAFNLFGEGLRRLIQEVGLDFNRLLNRYSVAGLLVLVLGLVWVRTNTGPAVFYRQDSAAFDGARAANAAQELSLSPGAARQDEIAEAFSAANLQAAGEAYSFFYQPQGRDAPHVIGHIPGQRPPLNSRVVLVAVPYTDEANLCAAGEAILGEVARLWHDKQYQPHKTFLFVAYSGADPPPSTQEFLEAKYGFASALSVESIVTLESVTGGDAAATLWVGDGSDPRLARLMRGAAGTMGTRTAEGKSLTSVASNAPELHVGWPGCAAGGQATPQSLTAVGRTLSLTLMRLGRDPLE